MDPVWRRQWDRPRARPGVAINLQCPVSFCSLELRANVGVSLCPLFMRLTVIFPQSDYGEESQRCPAWDTGRCLRPQGLLMDGSLNSLRPAVLTPWACLPQEVLLAHSDWCCRLSGISRGKEARLGLQAVRCGQG